MAKQVIDIGTTANDGTGDPIRTAFDKANDNFTELYDGKQALDATLSALAGAEWSSGSQVLTLTAADTVTLVTVGASAGNILNKAAGDALYTGKQTLRVLAPNMIARTTDGAATGTTESTTNKVMVQSFDFDDSTTEHVQFIVPMNKAWNEGTVTAQFIWTAGATGDVVWGIQAVALSDDDLIDAAFGTAVTVTDSVTAITDVMISAESTAVTIGGTPAEGDVVVFQVYRDTAGADTITGDVKLIGVRVFYTTNAGNDA